MDNQQPSLLYKELKEDSNYLIYADGRVYSKKSNRFLKGKIDNSGYLTYALAISDVVSTSGKKLSKMVYAHRLVALYFLDNPENLPYVHHKDENKLNNHYFNLEWATSKQNSAYSKKENSNRQRPRYLEQPLEGEDWMVIPDCYNYSVSNLGRIKNNRTNRILHLDCNLKYTRITLLKKHFYVHRLVYCVFHNDFDLEGYVIGHIDGNPRNNKIDNLQKITQQENCLRQAHFNK